MQFAFAVYGQDKEEHHSAHKYIAWDAKYTHFGKNNNLPDTFTKYDTLLTNFHQFNRASQFDNFIVATGNINSPYYDLDFNKNINIGFQTALFDFSEYSFTRHNIHYFDTKTPFTSVFYAQGDKETQQLNAMHSRNINPWLNFTLHFAATGADGFYIQQALHNRQFYFSTNFKSKNNNYKLFASYIYNRYHQQCNGGIKSQDFDSVIWRLRVIQPVLLNEAEQTVKNNSLNFYQFFKPDSSSPVSIAHSLMLTKNYFKYVDEDVSESYYKNIFIDSNMTNDSILWQLVENNLFFMNSSEYKKKIDFQSGFKHQSLLYQNLSIDTSMYYFGFFAHLQKKILRVNLFLKADYALSGQLRGDYKFTGGVFSEKIKHSEFSFEGSLTKQSTPVFYRFADMNHLNWNNSFNQAIYQQIRFKYKNENIRIKLNFDFSNVINYKYITDSIRPATLVDPVQVIALKAQHLLKLGNFYLSNHLLYQYSSNKDIIPLPLWALHHQFYYESDLYKNKFRLQTGYSVFIHHRFYMPAYFAQANLFYLQNTNLIGHYPATEIFLNMAIKRARIFVKVEQLHTFLMLKNSWSLPDYPVNPFNFKFGVSWLFYD